MNRRQFTQRFAALAATPALPISLATVAKAAPAAATSMEQPYLWASFVARIHDKASVSMLKRQLSLTDETATQVYNSLVKDGVVSAPNAQGISHAMNPFKRNFATSMASNPQSAFKKKAEEGLDRLLGEEESELRVKDDDDSEPVNSDSPECEDESDTRENPATCPAADNP